MILNRLNQKIIFPLTFEEKTTISWEIRWFKTFIDNLT